MPVLAPAFDQVLALAPHVRVERMADDIAFVIGERVRNVLASPKLVALAALVDGRRSTDEILRAAAGQMSEPEAWYFLDRLVASGFVVPAAPEDTPAAGAAFWHGVGVDAQAATQNVAAAAVGVRAVGAGEHLAPMADAMTDALRRADARVVSEPAADLSDVRVVVAVTDEYLAPALAELDRQMRAAGKPWLLVKPVGLRPLIGPLFRPGAGPCWTCLAHYVRTNRPVEELVRRRRGASGPISPPVAWVPATVGATCGVAALSLVRALAQPDREILAARVLAVDPDTLSVEPHAVIHRPQCPSCGDPGRMAAVGERRIALSPVARPHSDDGGYRRDAAQHTYDRLRHLVSPITGPVTHLVPMPERNTPLRAVWAAGYLACPSDRIPRTNEFDRQCAGKGRRAEQARVSALCETIERYSSIHQGDEARVRCRMADLDAPAHAPDVLQGFSDAQYDDQAARNRAITDRRQWVPERFDPEAVTDWTPGWSLTRDERCYVPLAYCYFELPDDGTPVYCRPPGNGVAAGTCVEEAILQGLLELVERDAVAVWWYNMIPRPAVDLGSFDDRYFDALQADYASHGWRLWVLDLTHDLGIPVCAALAHHPDADRYAVGFGCHLDGRLAAQRAVTELNQLFHPGGTYRAPWQLDGLPTRAFLSPDADAAAVSADQMPRAVAGDLRSDIEQCMARLAQVDVELVVVDKTRPDIDLCVVQTIAPGLRHFWPRFGPGRLYEVPHRLGWLPAPRDERALNPVMLFV